MIRQLAVFLAFGAGIAAVIYPELLLAITLLLVAIILAGL